MVIFIFKFRIEILSESGCGVGCGGVCVGVVGYVWGVVRYVRGVECEGVVRYVRSVWNVEYGLWSVMRYV